MVDPRPDGPWIVRSLRRSERVDLGVLALGALEGASPQRPRKRAELAIEPTPSTKFLSAVLASLADAGLVGSTRGKDGGYWLLRTLDQITLLDVVGALAPSTGQPQQFDRGLRGVWDAIDDGARATLATTTLRQVLDGGTSSGASPAAR